MSTFEIRRRDRHKGNEITDDSLIHTHLCVMKTTTFSLSSFALMLSLAVNHFLSALTGHRTCSAPDLASTKIRSRPSITRCP